MAKSKAAIKSRIKSINSTKKITGAMELISNIKFQKQLRLLNMNKDYSKSLEEIFTSTLANANIEDNIYSIDNGSKKRFVFVFVSDLGLCGGYNINLLKYLKDNYNSEDLFYCIGSNISSFFMKNNFKLYNEEIIYSDEIDYTFLKKIMEKAILMFRNKEIGSIEIVYTKFINNVSFIPSNDVILPVKLEKKEVYKEVLMEPNANVILDNIIPLVTYNAIYNRYLQAKTTEQASRRFAMENATDNANELIDNLTLVYNQARQAAITQEITEIVSGADAL